MHQQLKEEMLRYQNNSLMDSINQQQASLYNQIQNKIQYEVQHEIQNLTYLLVKDLISILPNETAKLFFLKKRLENFKSYTGSVELIYKSALEEELNDLRAKHEKV